MGSDSLQNESESYNESQGLIPRFLSNIFSTLSTHYEENQQHEDRNETQMNQQMTNKTPKYEISASFLEVYGEEIQDLRDNDQKSLPIREDSSGEVSVN